MPTPALIVMGALPPTRQDHLSLGRVAWHLSEALLLTMGQRFVVCACIRVNVIAIRCRRSNFRCHAFYDVPGLEGQDSTKEPRCPACLRSLLPRVGLKEVNITLSKE